MDLPVWQALYEELRDRNLTIYTVALECHGGETAGGWIRQANPAHPSLIDRNHEVAELFDWVNVPSIAWIDESGRIVRPNDPGWAGDYFRGMMDPGFDFGGMMAEIERLRTRYLDAIRDWVEHGERSRFALSAADVGGRLSGANPEHALAQAHFRLGTILRELGRWQEAKVALDRAMALRPESWSYRRQALELEEIGKGSSLDFWEAVKSLGDRPYYQRQDDL